jgi:anti-sigma B factor antagonist
MAIEEVARTEPTAFTAEIREEDGATVVLLAGELDISSAGALREVLVLPEVISASSVRVDLAKVEYLDSSGMGVLVSACKRIKASGGTFSVACAQGEPRRALEVSGLLEYLHVEDAA